MTLSDFFIYIKDNPKFAALIILIFLLCTYNEHVKEQLKHPEKKDKQRIPPLSVASADEAIGIVFGKKGNKVYYSKAEKEGHVFVCAASGAGKTTSIAIPSIQSFCKKRLKRNTFGGSIVILFQILASLLIFPVILNPTVIFQTNLHGMWKILIAFLIIF